MIAAMLAVTIPFASSTANAQPQRRYLVVTRDGRRYYTTRKPSFYRRHRNAINVGAATGGGALVGGLIGGRRGAGIGALAGAGSGALYTYKIKPKKRRYYRVR